MWSYIKAGAGDILLAVQQEILDITKVTYLFFRSDDLYLILFQMWKSGKDEEELGLTCRE